MNKLLPIKDNEDYFLAYLVAHNDLSFPINQKIIKIFMLHFEDKYFKKNELERWLVHNILMIEDKINLFNDNNTFLKLKDYFKDTTDNNSTSLTTSGSMENCNSDCVPPTMPCTIKDIEKYIVAILDQTANVIKSNSVSDVANRNLIDDFNKLLNQPSIVNLIEKAMLPLYPYVYDKKHMCKEEYCQMCRPQSFKDCENDPYFIDLKIQLNKMQETLNWLMMIKKGDVGIKTITATKDESSKECTVTDNFTKTLNFNFIDKSYEELGDNFCENINGNLKLNIPKGDKGEKGDKGDKGDVGSDLWEKVENRELVQLKQPRPVSFQNQIISDVETPELPTDGANKQYVDGEVAKKQCKLTAGDNITIDETTCTISASGGSGDSLWEVDGSITQLKNPTIISARSMRIDNVADPQTALDATNKQYVDNEQPFQWGNIETKNTVKYQGKEFLTMNSKKIVALADPVAATDAANKGYVDGELVFTWDDSTKAIGNYQGSSYLSMSSRQISSLADPTTPQDAANKQYVDNKFFTISTEIETLKSSIDELKVMFANFKNE